MASQRTTSFREVLTETEIAHIQEAQELYGGHAKAAALEFAEVLGFEPRDRQTLVGQVAVRLEDMDFEERRELATSFKNVAECLGGLATDQNRQLTPRLASNQDGLHPGAQSQDILAALGQGNNGNGNHHQELSSRNPLTKPQTTWLAKLMGEDNVDSVDELFLYQRLAFAGKLAERYKQLSISRLGPEVKKIRAEQMIALMGGSSYRQIADATGTTKHSLYQSLHTMAESIQKRIPREDIFGFLNEAANLELEEPITEDQPPEQGDQANEGLTQIQINWLEKAFGESLDLQTIESLTESQKEHLAELISRQVRSIFIPKDKSIEVTNRRVEELKLLITGSTYEEVSEAVELPLPNVKKELHYTAAGFNVNVPERDLESIVDRAKQYTEREGDE